MSVQEAMLGANRMSRLETNIFPIANLADLTARYELYRIRGLALGKHEYDHNAQILIGKLSRTLRAPVAILPVDDEPHLAVPAGTTRPETPLQLVRATAHVDRTDRIILLDYENPTLAREARCIRFLQFAIQGAFYDQGGFWQPAAGHPFF